jgi:hypothetical protein
MVCVLGVFVFTMDDAHHRCKSVRLVQVHIIDGMFFILSLCCHLSVYARSALSILEVLHYGM